MSQSLNLARVPAYVPWDDSTHRVMNPQKGNRPYFILNASNNDGQPQFAKNAYKLNGAAGLAISHPWTGTSYMYTATGCPIFAVVSSGALSFLMCSEYAQQPRRNLNYTGYYPAAIQSDADRAESWTYGRLTKLLGEVPTTGRLPGCHSYAELSEMASEFPNIPTNGIRARITRRQAQTTVGTTVDSTRNYICQVFNFTNTTCPDPIAGSGNNANDLADSGQRGNWFSTLMVAYSLENSILLAASGNTDYQYYVGEILTLYERLSQAIGYGGIVINATNVSVAPQTTDANKGTNWPYLSLANYKTHVLANGQYYDNYSYAGYPASP
jgi:hypothetical protein